MRKVHANKVLQRAFFIILSLVGLPISVWLGAHLFTAYSQWARAIAWLDSDVEDYKKFPFCTLQNTGPVYNFGEPPAGAPYSSAFETITYPLGEGAGTKDYWFLDQYLGPISEDFEQFLASKDTTAFLVIKDGVLLYEGYFNGYGKESTYTVFSVTKSFVSALVGVAIKEGYINSIDDPITDYIPELAAKDARFRRVTIRHLLTMTSGIRYEEHGLPWSDDAITYYAPDLRAAALENVQIVAAPGETFLYNNYNPLLIGIILERATGQSVCQYFEQKIWQPLGMEAPGSWSVDSASNGFAKMESGLNGRAIDFAKFGQLYLQEGNWNGQQIVPRAWVIESTRADTTSDPNWWYQYYWWVVTFEEPDHHYVSEDGEFVDFAMDAPPLDHVSYRFEASGAYGQFIYVIPEQNMVFVRLGKSDGGQYWSPIFEYLADRIAILDQ